MKPVAVIPMNDPTGIMFPHLEAITPVLKEIFARVFVSVTAVTQQAIPDYMAWLKNDTFFRAIYHETELSVGEDFLTLYANAAKACEPEQILHLCFIDRLAFALQSSYRAAFIQDIEQVTPEDTPLIFQRSEAAWATHPRNYYQLEQMVMQVGQWLFGKKLDFAWCHLALQAQQLQQMIPHIHRRDISLVAEFTLAGKDVIKTKDVDWLAWEDPFIFDRDPQQLKVEKEKSVEETQKRLKYVIPMLQLLSEAIRA
jgi:hypothetical protein